MMAHTLRTHTGSREATLICPRLLAKPLASALGMMRAMITGKGTSRPICWWEYDLQCFARESILISAQITGKHTRR